MLLYLDEIQYFNKKQQQSLLEFLEDGRITLIASTTENPYFYIYNALLSRSSVFEFRAVTPKEIAPALNRGLALLNSENGTQTTADDAVMLAIAQSGAGDVRRALGGHHPHRTVRVMSAVRLACLKMHTIRQLTA